MVIRDGIGVERVQPPAKIKLELDERTAELLCALIGGVRGGRMQNLFSLLDDALPNRTDGFEDVLEGPAPVWRSGIT